LLASIGRSGVVLLFVALARQFGGPFPKILRDIAQGVVYLAILLTALRVAGVEPGSILTTSAILTAAIALSLQETLGNMVAGLAIQVQRPFDEEDWIQFDSEAKHIGRVIEINWRATKVVTLDEVEVIIPNATLAKAPITNFTKPTGASRRSLYVQVSPSVPPHLVESTILEVLPGSLGVLAEPPPSVVNNGLVDGNVEYWVRFYTRLFHRRDGVDGAARDHIWYAFSRAGIPFATPNRNVALREVSSASQAQDEVDRRKRLVDALGRVDFLRPLSEEQRTTLALRCGTRLYMAGETIVHQGEESGAMFIIQEGEVSVEFARGGAPAEIARLGVGRFFGEMALMTGQRRQATVRARSNCTLLVVDQESVRFLLGAAPDLAEHMSGVMAQRQATIDQFIQNAEEPVPRSVEERRSVLLERIRRFFAM
jgi:small-conductance mechanosensitive channel/CRP-like cAMP-binding protein